jgi:hypothetical protein
MPGYSPHIEEYLLQRLFVFSAAVILPLFYTFVELSVTLQKHQVKSYLESLQIQDTIDEQG